MGESLFASTEQPVYRLEPCPEEREPRERWSLSLQERTGEVEKPSHDLQKSGEKFGELFFLYYLCPQKYYRKGFV